MTELLEFALFVAAVAFVAGVIICTLCAIKAVQFYAGDRVRGRRRRIREPLSPRVPLEPMRRSTFGPLDIAAETELDRRRALRDGARDPEHTGC